MKRRDFILTLAGAAPVSSVAVRAQQSGQSRRIGLLMNRVADSSEGQARIAAIRQRLQQVGWSEAQNLRMEIRWDAEEPELARPGAVELAALAPDVILAGGTLSLMAMLRASRTIPIVFAGVADPVGLGVVASLAHPGGNATGFLAYEYSFAGKLLELLKQIAPGVTRAAILRDAASPQGIAMFAAIQSAATSIGVQVSPVDLRDSAEIERAVAAFARSRDVGLVVTPSGVAASHNGAIVELAARYKLPAVYGYRQVVIDGGLISYGPDWLELYRRAAGYVDRILRGEKPADLPVQAPTSLGAAVPLWAKAQQAMPVIGFLSDATPEAVGARLTGFHRGLLEMGFADGRNVAIEFRGARGNYDLLAELAADLVRRNVAVIVTTGSEKVTRAAKAATTTIPIVATVAGDPVRRGLVASVNRPGGTSPW